jgi:hypothetical protein
MTLMSHPPQYCIRNTALSVVVILQSLVAVFFVIIFWMTDGQNLAIQYGNLSTHGTGLSASLQQEPLHLNPQPVSPPLAHLKLFYSNLTIGGMILVTSHYHSDGKVSSSPHITIIAASLLITLGQFRDADPPGIDYADFWDDSILAPRSIPITDGLHCPLLAAAEGFLRAVKLPDVIDFLYNTQPLLFPTSKHYFAG